MDQDAMESSMNAGRRTGSTTIAILAALLGLTYTLTIWLAPDWCTSAGLDVWQLPTLQKQIEVAAKNDIQLKARLDDVQTRMATKTELVESLLAGRTTLKNVTAEFLALNNDSPAMLSIRTAYVGKTDEEKMARNVMDFAAPYAMRSPELALRVECLQNELRQMRFSSSPQK
jgi:hypothetical protein